MKNLFFCSIVCLLASCGSGDVGEGYHSTADSSELNQKSKNILNNTTPVNDDTIGGAVEQPYTMGKNSLNTSTDSVQVK